MFRIPRRLLATVAAAATILMLTTGTVAAADPDARASAHANASSAGVAVTLGARSHPGSTDARAAGLQLHGGGLGLPATDAAPAPLDAHDQASGTAFPPVTWALLLLVGILGSLRYMARRSRL